MLWGGSFLGRPCVFLRVDLWIEGLQNSVDTEIFLDCFGLDIPIYAFFVTLAMTFLM